MVRIKHRYLLLNILYPSQSPGSITATIPSTVPAHLSFLSPTPNHITSSAFIRLIRDQILLVFGDHGVGLVNPSLKCNYFSNATSTAIIRCPRAHYQLVWVALTYINALPGDRGGGKGLDCVIRVVRVSGTIRKAEEEAVRRARAEIVRVKLGHSADGGKRRGVLDRPTSTGDDTSTQQSVTYEDQKDTNPGSAMESFDDADMEEDSD